MDTSLFSFQVAGISNQYASLYDLGIAEDDAFVRLANNEDKSNNSNGNGSNNDNNCNSSNGNSGSSGNSDNGSALYGVEDNIEA